MQEIYYYIQGFRLDDTFESIRFVLSLCENKISDGPKVIVHYKIGAKTEDFESLLPDGMTIHSNKTLSTQYCRKLKPKLIKFNTHLLEIYDLDSRLVNYLVTTEKESTLLEDFNHTSWVISRADADDETLLRSELDKSLYVKWLSTPTGEYYSYKSVNTASTHDVEDRIRPGNLHQVGGGEGSPPHGIDIPGIVSKNNTPIDFGSYTKWRLEYSTVLLGFYDQLKLQLPEFDIYMDGQKVKCLDNMNSERIDIRLDNLANMDRRPFIYEHDLYYSRAELSMVIRTSDQLKYMHLKKKFQNIEMISTITEFWVKDKLGLDWLNHVWWERHQDATQLATTRDNEGRVSFNLDLRCTLYFYEVEDEMFELIKFIRVVFANLPGKPSKLYTLKQ